MTCGINRGAPERESSLCRRRTRLSSSLSFSLLLLLLLLLSSYTASLSSREKNTFRESGRSSMATTANGGTRIPIDVATTVSRGPEYHFLVDVGSKTKFPVDETLVTVDRYSLSYEHTRVYERYAQWFFVTRFFCCFSVALHVPLSSRDICTKRGIFLFLLLRTVPMISVRTVYTRNERTGKVTLFSRSYTLREEHRCPSLSTPRKASRHFPTVLIGPAYYPCWPTEREVSRNKEKDNSRRNDSLTLR